MLVAFLALEEVEEEVSGGTLGFADSFFHVELVLAGETLVGSADIAVGVIAGRTLSVELVVSVGAGGFALFIEEVVVGLADIAGAFVFASSAVGDARFAFSFFLVETGGAFRNAFSVMHK
jgi:hypothetical protein